MNYSIEYLSSEDEEDYENFINSVPTALFYASLGYRNLLKKFLDAEDHYFIARNSERKIVGALPSFVKAPPGKKGVVNSLPFYGSNGGVITADVGGEVAGMLLRHFCKFAEDRNFISSTVISSPFDHDLSQYEKNSNFTLSDTRIGQLTRLPPAIGDSHTAVMKALHYKNRNMVRKAAKLGVSVTNDHWDGSLEFLAKTHLDNMAKIGGQAKPFSFFKLIEEEFKYGTEYQVYTAWVNGAPVSAMLLFFFNEVVEYFTPVIVNEHRSSQPLSLLIYYAMVHAVERNYKWWNWGGTWLTQDGVYQFKRSWGAIDFPYKYFIRILDKKILTMSKENLQKDYPYFFVVPFSALS